MAYLFDQQQRYYLIAPDGELVAGGITYDLIAHYQQMYDNKLYVGKQPIQSRTSIIAESLWPIFLAGAIWVLVLIIVSA